MNPKLRKWDSHPTGRLEARGAPERQCGGQALPLLATSGVAVPAAEGSVPRLLHKLPCTWSELGSDVQRMVGGRARLCQDQET